MSQPIRAITFTLFAAPLGLWLGEHEATPLAIKSVALLLFLAVGTAAMWWRTKRSLAVYAAFVTAVVFSVTWVSGSVEAGYAFNECVHDGESVRTALAAYHSRTGTYPESLSELRVHLPGQLLLPPRNTLSYTRTARGYTLVFSDWLVSHTATDAQPFMAIK